MCKNEREQSVQECKRFSVNVRCDRASCRDYAVSEVGRIFRTQHRASLLGLRQRACRASRGWSWSVALARLAGRAILASCGWGTSFGRRSVIMLLGSLLVLWACLSECPAPSSVRRRVGRGVPHPPADGRGHRRGKHPIRTVGTTKSWFELDMSARVCGLARPYASLARGGST